MKKLFISVMIILISFNSFAHSSGTDRNGCHHDRKNGTYHCH